VGSIPEAGVELPTAGLSVEVLVSTAEVPTGAGEAPPSSQGRGNMPSPV
jgi:hypothetical protein